MSMSAIANTPRCPNCGQHMTLARTTPRVGGLQEMRTFECRPCNVVQTEVSDDLSARPYTRYRGGGGR